jgi:hypothetical protein
MTSKLISKMKKFIKSFDQLPAGETDVSTDLETLGTRSGPEPSGPSR